MPPTARARPANSIHRATITTGDSRELSPPEPLTVAVAGSDGEGDGAGDKVTVVGGDLPADPVSALGQPGGHRSR